MMEPERRSLSRKLIIPLLLILVVVGVVIAKPYRGFRLGSTNQMIHGTYQETYNLMLCIIYWLDFMEKLSFNEDKQRYDFDGAFETEQDPFEKGRIAYHQGNFAAAIELIEQGIAEQGESEDRLFWLASSYMRHAEFENCLVELMTLGDAAGADPTDSANAGPTDTEAAQDTPMDHSLMDHSQISHSGHGGEFCTLPLQRYHQRSELSQKAADLLVKLLDEYDADDQLYRWLLNFSYMTIGGFPHDVPERYRIETSFIDYFYGQKRDEIAATYSHLNFVDRAGELGVSRHDAGRGVAIEDFNRDGHLDIISANSFSSARYYVNRGDGTFEDRSAEAGFDDVLQTFTTTAADYDNDGWVDVFFSRPFDRSKLFRNQGNGTFVDVSESSGVNAAIGKSDEVTATWVTAWGDVDNDGDLDLFVAQWAFKLPFVQGLMDTPRADSALLINDGNGHFTNRSYAFGLKSVIRDKYYIGASFGDFDNDGDSDLYLSSPLRNTSLLLENIEGERFVHRDVVKRRKSGFVASFVDVNHDGRLDIFQSGFGDARTSTEQTVFGEPRDKYLAGQSSIVIQGEDGIFIDREEYFKSDMPMGTMGANFGDLNNDGCYDFYLGTGNPESWFVLPNQMYIGEVDGKNCTGVMENITMLFGFGTIQKGHGIAFFDFDNDGDQDVYSSLGGMWPGDGWPNQLFVNESNLENSWVKLRLRGRKTNYYGVGARIRVFAQDASGEEIIRTYAMTNGTGFGSNPYLAHIGLLDAVSIHEVEVYWPTSDCQQSYSVDINALNELDEIACFE